MRDCQSVWHTNREVAEREKLCTFPHIILARTLGPCRDVIRRTAAIAGDQLRILFNGQAFASVNVTPNVGLHIDKGAV